MELRHLRYFVAVAEELNFRRASVRLRVAQPSLSVQVRQLEEEIGFKLLERNSRQVLLTAAGQNFLDGCRRVLRDVEDTTRTAGRIARGEAGHLSIGFATSLAYGLLPGVLRAYRKKFPEVELRLLELDSTQQIEALQARRLDLGFIGLGLTAENTDLELVVVAEERLVAAVPLDHPLARRPRKSIPLSALAQDSFLLSSRQNAPVYNPWLIVLCQQAGFQPHIVQEAGQPVIVLNYVAAGLGVTVLPAQFSRHSMTGVRFIPLADPAPTYRYCAAWRPENKLPALAQFVEVAREVARVAGRGDGGAPGARAGDMTSDK